MKRFLMSVVAATLLIAPAALGQDLVEYARQPVAPPKVAKTTMVLAFNDVEQKAPGKMTEVAAQEKNAPEKKDVAVKPSAVAIFILTNGHRIESANYIVKVDSVQLEEKGMWRTIPLSSLNVKETVAANKERGIDLVIPDNANQITLSF